MNHTPHTSHAQSHDGAAMGFATLVIILTVLATLTLMSKTAQGAGLLVADGAFGGALEIKEHTVDVVINNGVAVTTIEQTFLNTENRTVEALYTFPVPASASVADFSMWINGQEMIGEVVEKERAREIYNSYKQQPRPKDPGLLEQVDYRTFELRIFPIFANAEQRIRIVYYQQLDFDHDWATYVYPLATTTRPGVDAKVTGKFALRLQVKSEIPLTSITSPSHGQEFVIARHGDHALEASLEAAGGDLSRDLVLAFQTQRARTGVDVITSRPKGEDGYFMLTLTAGQELAKLADAQLGKDYLFVLDISGSMANQGKLPLSKNMLGAFIQNLDEKDRFELISFNIDAKPVFNQLQKADEANRQKAMDQLDSLLARGGTRLSAAMNLAYQYADADREMIVVLVSDGMNEQRERQELLALLNRKPVNARVFTIGVGNDINRPLLSQIAQDTGGLAAFLSQGDDFERQAQAFRRKLTKPIASDVKLTFSDSITYDLEGDQVSALYHGSPIRIYGRYKPTGHKPVNLRVQANIMGQAYDQQVAITLPDADQMNPEIERMWAWHRVDRLLKQADRAGSRDSVIPEIIRLGEGYSIVTEYTSFLVLENDQEYQRWNLKRRNALRVQRDRAAQEAVRKELEALRQKNAQTLGPANNASNLDNQLANARQNTAQARNPQNASPQQPAQPSRGVDLPMPRRGGGGAIDPAAAIIAMLMAGGLVYATIHKHRRAA